MDATWHSGPHDSTTRAHATPTRRDVTFAIFIFIISIWFIVSISLSIIRNTLTHIIDVPYIPAWFL